MSIHPENLDKHAVECLLHGHLIAIILGWLCLLLPSGWDAKNVATASRSFVPDTLGWLNACWTHKQKVILYSLLLLDMQIKILVDDLVMFNVFVTIEIVIPYHKRSG